MAFRQRSRREEHIAHRDHKKESERIRQYERGGGGLVRLTVRALPAQGGRSMEFSQVLDLVGVSVGVTENTFRCNGATG